MNFTALPGPRRGSVTVPASKSQAHRLLICAALGTEETLIRCDGISRDIAATIRCLNAIGAEIGETEAGLLVLPRQQGFAEAALPCAESGSTLRFLIPILGALGQRGAFRMEGKLPSRPLGPLAEVNYRRGMIRTKGSFGPFLTSPISAIFLAIAIAVLVLYATKPLRMKRKAAKAAAK